MNTQSNLSSLKPTSKTTEASRHPPVAVLRNLFDERKANNAHYSLNAFARDLGMSASLLSRLMSGSRNLTLRQGLHIAAVLGFTQSETNLFVLGIVENASSSAKISRKVRETIERNSKLEASQSAAEPASPLYVNYDVERFKTISQWYHLAILNLTFTHQFESSPVFISERLGITPSQAKSAIERLLELGFLESLPDGSLRKTKANLYFKTSRSDFAMREYQGQMIDKAKAELQKTSETDFANRLINSITFACGPEHLELLKKKIDEFQDEVLALTKAGPHREVYQLNCQLFPLTQTQKPTHSGEKK